MNLRRQALLALALVTSPFAFGCTKKVTIDPRAVTELTVRPFAKRGPLADQLLYCPGDAFQVELVAEMSDGTLCSNLDKRTGCLGHSKALIVEGDVHITGSGGEQVVGPKFTWMPDPDPLATAATGMKLEGWLDVTIEGQELKTKVARAKLKPVYSCMESTIVLPATVAGAGQDGAPGPDLDVYAAPFATPFYPEAVIVRIESPTLGLAKYVVSATPVDPVVIASKGGAGGAGFSGERGMDGAAGASATSTCGTGGAGGAGSAGGPGGHGGNGGSGGSGGAGGSPGSSGDGCTGTRGPQGPAGPSGPSGRSGVPGSPGPSPRVSTMPRGVMFATEAPRIRAIEGGSAAKDDAGDQAQPSSSGKGPKGKRAQK
jgi:hypothetical protein